MSIDGSTPHPVSLVDVTAQKTFNGINNNNKGVARGACLQPRRLLRVLGPAEAAGVVPLAQERRGGRKAVAPVAQGGSSTFRLVQSREHVCMFVSFSRLTTTSP